MSSICRWSYAFLTRCLGNSPMSLIPGTLVRLPDGRDGIVIPHSLWQPGRVFVKVRSGRKRWFRVEDCIPIATGC